MTERNDAAEESQIREAARLLRDFWRKWQRSSHPSKKGAVSLEQYLVLHFLGQTGPLPVSQVAERLGTTVSAATILTQRMERVGLVRRSRGGDDNRVVEINLLPLGEQNLATWEKERQDGLVRLLSSLPAEAVEQLIGILQQLNPQTRHSTKKSCKSRADLLD